MRDRSPLVRFAGKAYVLPRTGQRGIPVVTVNTRGGEDQGSIASATATWSDNVAGRRLPAQPRPLRTPTAWRKSAACRCGRANWRSSQQLNADITTAFPVDQAVGDLQPGVYVMTAEPATAPSDD